MDAIFQTYGVSILQSEHLLDMTLYGEEIFGDKVATPLTNEKSELIIDPSIPEAPHVAKITDKELEAHTDGLYGYAGSVLTFRCDIAAPSGGASVLISGHAMYEAAKRDLAAQDFEALFKPSLRVGRQYEGKAYEEAWLTIFSRGADGRITMQWRSRDKQLKEIAPAAVPGFEYLEKFVKAEENRFVVKLVPGQTLVIDNAALLHARTAYPRTERRHLVRMHYYGNRGSLRAQYGFPTPLSLHPDAISI